MLIHTTHDRTECLAIKVHFGLKITQRQVSWHQLTKSTDSFLKYHRKPKFKVGDRVRIKKHKNLFDKNYDANFSDEYYTIIDIINYFPVNMYSLESLDRNDEDKKLMGYFYEYQIQKVDQYEHRISSIIQRKGNKSLVRWKGFSKKFDTWEPNENIRDLNVG